MTYTKPIFNYISILTRTPQSTLFPYTTLFRSMNMDDDNIVWGNNSPDDDNIVWGNLDDDNIVWGNLSDDNIVWGNSLDDDNRSEEHTSELQSRRDLVCRLLLEKKNRRADD